MLGDPALSWHLDPNLVFEYGAQIASSRPNESEEVGRRELFGPPRTHGDVPMRVREGPRPLHGDTLRSLPCTD